jgi:hypothetical protein
MSYERMEGKEKQLREEVDKLAAPVPAKRFVIRMGPFRPSLDADAQIEARH